MEQPLTPSEAIRPFVAQHPDTRFAVTESELGAWCEAERRYVPFACLTITGHWVFMPYEILVNGQRIERNWIPAI